MNRLFLIVILAFIVGTGISAQRKITPVKPSVPLVGVNENRKDSAQISSAVSNVASRVGATSGASSGTVGQQTGSVATDASTALDSLGNPSVEVLQELDSLPPGAPVGRVPKMINPLLFSATVGVDIWDPLMRAFGQSYGIIGFSAELNLHNRYIPVVEIGLGNADNTPKGQNFTYHSPATPYFRIGCNYNFLYNSNPDYQFVAGIRYGWSHFSYQLRDVSIDDPYWGENRVVDFPEQHSNVSYLQVLFGLRVKIWKPISMGWNLRFRTILHETAQPSGKPWYIPGYGARGGVISGSFSIFYTIPLTGNKK